MFLFLENEGTFSKSFLCSSSKEQNFGSTYTFFINEETKVQRSEVRLRSGIALCQSERFTYILKFRLRVLENVSLPQTSHLI